MRKRRLVLFVAGVLVLFFVFAPVVPTYLIPCIAGPPLDFASLSNHFFSVGVVYLPVQGRYGSYQFWTHGAIFCI